MNRTIGAPFVPQQNTAWAQPQLDQGQAPARKSRQPFGAVPDRHFRSNSASDRSDSANEVENMLVNNRPPARRTSDQGGWTTNGTGQRARPAQQRGTIDPLNDFRTFQLISPLVFAPPTTKRMSNGFKPTR